MFWRSSVWRLKLTLQLFKLFYQVYFRLNLDLALAKWDIVIYVFPLFCLHVFHTIIIVTSYISCISYFSKCCIYDCVFICDLLEDSLGLLGLMVKVHNLCRVKTKYLAVSPVTDNSSSWSRMSTEAPNISISLSKILMGEQG